MASFPRPKDYRNAVFLVGWVFAGLAFAEVDCAFGNLIGGATSWFGTPDYNDCHRLIFGNNDLSGIAAIDNWSHAFIQAGASQDHESNSEWANRVILPKFWANTGCKIALMLVESIYDHMVQRDTGQWLSIADAAEAVNQVCVAGQSTGGMEETGDNKRLWISLYQPGSPQDRNIEDARRHGELVTMPMIRDEDGNSLEDDLDDLQDHFADLLNIHEDPDYPQPLPTWERGLGHFHVGESDPQVRNLGNSWELRYNSVTNLLPANHAANGLSSFYLHIVKIASEKIASNAAPNSLGVDHTVHSGNAASD
ncbi:MAG: hypothetical protein Q9216_004483 [Gyalolechia sp. 2 TL-2023]